MASDCLSSEMRDAKPHLPLGLMDAEQPLIAVPMSLPTATTGHSAWEKPDSESRRKQAEV